MELLPTFVYASGIIATITTVALFAIKIIATAGYLHATAYYPIPLVITWGTSLVIFSINFILSEVKREVHRYPHPASVDLHPDMAHSFSEVAHLLSATMDELIHSVQELTEASLEGANPDLKAQGRANTTALIHTLATLKRQLLEDMNRTGVLTLTKDGLQTEKGIRNYLLKELKRALRQERVFYIGCEDPREKAEIAKRVDQLKMQIAWLEPYQECDYMQKCNPLHKANDPLLKWILLSFANKLRELLHREKISLVASANITVSVPDLTSPLLQNIATPFIPNEEVLISMFNKALDSPLLRSTNVDPSLQATWNTLHTFRQESSSAPLFELLEYQLRTLFSVILCSSTQGGGFYRAFIIKEIRPALTQLETKVRELASNGRTVTAQEFLLLLNTREGPLGVVNNAFIEARRKAHRTSINAVALLLIFSALSTLIPSLFCLKRGFTIISHTLAATTLALALGGLLENYRGRHKKFTFNPRTALPTGAPISIQVIDEVNLTMTKLQTKVSACIDASIQMVFTPVEQVSPKPLRKMKSFTEAFTISPTKTLSRSFSNVKKTKKDSRPKSLSVEMNDALDATVKVIPNLPDAISRKVATIKDSIAHIMNHLRQELLIIQNNQTLQDVLLCEGPFYRKYYDDYAAFLQGKIVYETERHNRPEELARLQSAHQKAIENLDKNIIERLMPKQLESLNFLKLIPYRITLLLQTLPDVLNTPLKKLIKERKVDNSASGMKKTFAMASKFMSQAIPDTVTLRSLLQPSSVAGAAEDYLIFKQYSDTLLEVALEKINELFVKIRHSPLYQELNHLTIGNKLIAIINEMEELAVLLAPEFLNHQVAHHKTRSVLMKKLSDSHVNQLKAQMEKLAPDWFEADKQMAFVKKVIASVCAQQSLPITDEELLKLYEEFAHKEMEAFPTRNPEILAHQIAQDFLSEQEPSTIESIACAIVQVDAIINNQVAAARDVPTNYDLSYNEVLSWSTSFG